jgi:hypothetical protein
MLDDHWLVYESANLRHFVIFCALSGGAGWMVIRGGKYRKVLPIVLSSLPVLAVADLLIVYASFNPQVDPTMLGYPTETTSFLKSAAPGRVVSLEQPGQGIKSFIVPNFNAVFDLREVQGADSLHTKKIHRLLEKVVFAMEPGRGTAFPDPNTIHVPNVSNRLFDLLNVQYVTTMPGAPCPDATRLDKALDAELTVWRNRQALGPAWIVGRSESFNGLNDFLTKLGQPGFDPRQTALLEEGQPALDPAAAGSSVRLTDFSAHRVAMEVDARGTGLLVASEIAFPGWLAWVDGKPVTMQTADHILRAVPVSAGDHRVEMRYIPTSYLFGLYLTCVASAAIAAFSFGSRSRSRKPIL